MNRFTNKIIRETNEGHPPPSPMNAFIVAIARAGAPRKHEKPPLPAGFQEAKKEAFAVCEELGLHPRSQEHALLVAEFIEHATTN